MKKIFKLALIFGIIILSVIAFMFYRSYEINKGFNNIKYGDNESRVITLIGKPSKVVFLRDNNFWSSYIKGSVKEYHYEPNILPEIWVIGYDADNNVIYKNHNLM